MDHEGSALIMWLLSFLDRSSGGMETAIMVVVRYWMSLSGGGGMALLSANTLSDTWIS